MGQGILWKSNQIVSICYVIEGFTIWLLSNGCLAAGTDAGWPTVSGETYPLCWSYFAILSAIRETLELLWGQKWIPLSSCRLLRWTLGQYHVPASLTFVLRLSIRWHPAIISILFNNHFVPSLSSLAVKKPITNFPLNCQSVAGFEFLDAWENRICRSKFV